MTKTERVRNLLNAGKLTPMEIAKNVKVSKSYVYGLKAKMTAKPKAKAKAETIYAAIAIPAPAPKPNGKITVAEFVVANKLDAFQHIIVHAVVNRENLDIAKRIIDVMLEQGS